MNLKNPHPALLADDGKFKEQAVRRATVKQLTNWIFNRLALRHSELFPVDHEVEDRPYGALVDNVPKLGVSEKQKFHQALIECLSQLKDKDQTVWQINNGGSYLLYSIGCLFDTGASAEVEKTLKHIALNKTDGVLFAADAANALVLMGVSLDAAFWTDVYGNAPASLKERVGAIALGGLSNTSFEAVVKWLQVVSPSPRSLEAVIAPILITELRRNGTDRAVSEVISRYFSRLNSEHQEILSQAASDIGRPNLVPAPVKQSPQTKASILEVHKGSPFTSILGRLLLRPADTLNA